MNGFPTILAGCWTDPNVKSVSAAADRSSLMTVNGKVDGEAEQGESILLDIPITHGDSGAPIIDTKANRVVGMVLGLASGYGTARWVSGDGLGLSVAALTAFLGQNTPSVAPPKPAYSVAMVPNPNDDVVASWPQLAASAGFFPPTRGKRTRAERAAGDAPTANAVIEESGDASTLSIDVSDCSGATFYRDSMTIDRGGHPRSRAARRPDVAGFVDTHAGSGRRS